MALDLHETGVLSIFRESNRRKGSYAHKDQIGFYENVNKNEDCYMECEPSDSEELLGSEQFRKRYRFCEKTVNALCLLLGKEIEPLATTNNAFTAMQKLCIALRFYATGSHQIVIGDGEGASQASVSRIVKQVTLALAGHADDLISFNIDQEVMETVAKGFYGFSGSMYQSYFYIAGGRCIIE